MHRSVRKVEGLPANAFVFDEDHSSTGPVPERLFVDIEVTQTTP